MSLASPAASALARRSCKRKRSHISYVEEYYLDEEDDVEAADIDLTDHIDDAESEDDGTYGEKHTSKTKKARVVKGSAEARENKKTKPFRFLDLSAELRNRVYEFALTEPNGLTLVARTKKYRRCVVRGPIDVAETDRHYGKKYRYRYHEWSRSWASEQDNDDDDESEEYSGDRLLVPNLLAVNKQIHEEATSYLYKQEMILEDTNALHIFLASIGPSNRELLTEVTLRGWGVGKGTMKGYNFAALTMLQGCTNLQTLLFECSLDGYREPVGLARQIYRDGVFFLEAIGDAQGSYDAAVDVVRLGKWHFDPRHDPRCGRKTVRPLEPEVIAQSRRDEFEGELRRLLAQGAER
ncbi:hypothetical protein BST61_g8297 [Cercospora zeina]